MNVQPKTVIAVLALAIGACAQPTTTSVPDPVVDTIPPVTDTMPEPVDAPRFGFVSIDRQSGDVVVEFDEAEMLTGDAAVEAAVDAGVIAEGEDLPNDFFIVDGGTSTVQLELADAVSIAVLSGDDPATTIEVDLDVLADLYDGSYEGPAVYGIAPGQPIAMNVHTTDGVVTAMEAVYLP